MKREYRQDIILDELGNIDFNYYINKANRLRSQEIAAQLQKASNGIKNAVASVSTAFSSPKPA